MAQTGVAYSRLVGVQLLTACYTANTFDTGDTQCGQKVQAPVDLLNCDLKHIAGCRQDEIRMIDTVLGPISHSNYEWLERTGL